VTDQLTLDLSPRPATTPRGCRRCVSPCIPGPLGEHRKPCGCPCVPDGCAHAAPDNLQARVTEQQRRIVAQHGTIVTPHTRAQLRALARRWELEARRGYPSAPDARRYAANLRWQVELLDAGGDIHLPIPVVDRKHRRHPIRNTTHPRRPDER